MIPSKRLLGILAFLFAVWLILSGHYQALIIFFGVVSCALVAWIQVRMDRTDGEHHFGIANREMS